jgi:enoyl-CoA hydratase/carnithine racemase
MTSLIQVSSANGVQTIRMNRPDKKNALTADMYARMAKALRASGTDDSIRANLILGVEGAFSSGNDIAEFAQFAVSGGEGLHSVFEFLEEIITCQKPLVAGVNGLAIGVGTTMLMHCDYVVASDTSLLKTPFVDLGLVPEAGSSLIAPHIMGHQRAFELLVIGEGWSAETAKAAGLVNKVISADELEAAALSAAQAIAGKPPEALALSRYLVRGDRADVLARMKEEAQIFRDRLSSKEAREAFLNFMAKGQNKGKKAS